MIARASLSGVRKAAIVTLLLGEEGATEVLKCLSRDEVERIAGEIAALGTVQAADSEGVLEEFHKAVVAATRYARGGIDSAQRLLDNAFGPEAAESVVERIAKSARSTAGFTSLTLWDPHQLSKFVVAEQPQTVALILAHLDGAHAAKLASLLPEELRTNVITRMANLDEISPEVVDQISSVIDRRLRSLGGASHESLGGVRAVAGLLNRLDRSVGGAVLEQVEHDNPDLAASIRNLMFVFEDLRRVEDAALREITQRADRKVLTVALKGASENMRDRFFDNMSKRAAGVLREDLEVLGAVRMRDVEQAQREVVSIARKLEEEGLLTTDRATGEAFVV